MSRDKKESLGVFLGALLAAIAFGLAYKTVIDLDFWWHLAAGRWIVEHHAFITRDMFSFTFRGSPWVDLTWGFESLIYLLHLAGGGYWLISAAMALLAAATVYVAWSLFLALDRRADATTLGLGFLFFLLALPILDLRWIQRPEQLTHFFGIVFLAILWKWRESSRARVPWTLALVQVLWVNSHGLFVLGPFLVAVFLFSDLFLEHPRGGLRGWRRLPRHPLTLALAAVLGACLVNPRFVTGATFPAHLWSVLNDPFYKSTIPEATPPLADAVWGFDAWAFFLYGLAIAASLGVPLLRRSLRDRVAQRGAGYFPIAFALIWVSLPARRNIALLVAWTLPWVAHFLVEECRRWLPRALAAAKVRRFAAAIAAIALFAIVTNLFRSPVSPIRFGGEMARRAHPARAAAILTRLPRRLRLFAGVHFSDYMLFNVPAYEPYLDGRFAELYPKSHFQRYMEILAHPPKIDEEVERLALDGVALGTDNAMEHGLIRHLSGRPGWRVLFFDETSVIFVTGSVARALGAQGVALPEIPALADESERDIEREFARRSGILDATSLRRAADHALAATRLGETLLLLGRIDLAEGRLRRALDLYPRFPLALSMDCVQRYLRLERDAATRARREGKPVPLDELGPQIAATTEACALAAKAGSDREAPLLTLGLIEMNTGRPTEAAAHFERVVRRNPAHFSGYLLLGRAWSALRTPEGWERAEAAYRRAQRLRPLDPTPDLELGNALRAAGAETRAREFFAEAQAIQARGLTPSAPR